MQIAIKPTPYLLELRMKETRYLRTFDSTRRFKKGMLLSLKQLLDALEKTLN